MSSLRRPLLAFALAWGLFALAVVAPRVLALAGASPEGSPVGWSHAVVKLVLVIVALAAMRISGGPWAEWGFRSPTDARWGRGILRGGLLGALTSVAIMLTPAVGMTWIRELGIVGLVLWVWLVSSVSEEIFVRGWFQAFLRPSRQQPFRLGPWAVSPAVLVSGLFFGSMHLTLLARGTDLWTVGIIVTATTLLGLFAAEDRERSSSLGPPIATHIAFNVGGLLGGIVTAIAVAIATGQTPGG